MRAVLLLLAYLLTPAVALAQAGSPAPVEPASGQAMTRAAGMPLGDGALAPGMLTVRIVRGDFSNNAADQDVTVEVTGGSAQTARTGADGRAQFAHLAVGAEVRALATVDGQPLASEVFKMPAESGVRLLLVAGDGPATAVGPAAGGVVPASADALAPTGGGTGLATAAPPSRTGSTAAAGAEGIDPVDVIRALLAGASVLAIGLLLRRGRRSAGGRAGGDDGPD